MNLSTAEVYSSSVMNPLADMFRIDLLLLSEDLVLTEKFEELSFCHFLLAFRIELTAPSVLYEFHVLTEREPVGQVELILLANRMYVDLRASSEFDCV